MSLDIDVLIIGAGMSGLGTAVQLVRQHDTRKFEIIEKSDNVGGTWWQNSYPGCGCDVPSHFYSYSFALNPDWSQTFAMQPEIQAYFESVARKYDIVKHVTFRTVVDLATWEEETATWLVTVRDLTSKQTYQRRCKILISAVGALSTPKKCDIPGASVFRGKIFHSAEWDHSFDWKDREVVTIGNGCSATQFVPIISEGTNAVKKVTQFSRQAHWLAERHNPTYNRFFKWSLRWVPGLMRLYRAKIYWQKERDFSAFSIKDGSKTREAWSRDAARYIRATAPAKYRDFLVPKTAICCKRRVNDTHYLLSLHRDNVELIYDDPIAEIVEEGVRTQSGRLVRADAITLATGFETQNALYPMKILGEGGIDINDHWKRVSDGASSAYFGTCIAGFPNMFCMMGPNTLSGHLSVIYTSECQINFTMRVVEPIMRALGSSRALFSSLGTYPDTVVVKPGAESKDLAWVQNKAKQLVWATGCTSWFIDEKTGRNTIMYPDYQYMFWWRSLWIPWRDFSYTRSKLASRRKHMEKVSSIRRFVNFFTVMICLGIGALVVNAY